MRGHSRTRGRMLLAGILAVAGVGVLGLTPPAAAQAPEQDKLTLRRVDSTDTDKVAVAFRYNGDPDDIAGLRLRENGKEIETSAGDDVPYRSSFVMVFDTSASTDASAVLAKAKEAAENLIASADQGQSIAVVAAGPKATIDQPLTTDKTAVREAVSELTPGGDGTLWEGIVLAARRYDRQPNLLPTIVVISDGNEGGTVPAEQARGAVVEAGAQVLAIGVQDGDADLSALAKLAEVSGGLYVETTDASDIPSLVDSLVPTVNGDHVIVYDSEESRGVVNLTLTVGEYTTNNSYVSGSVAQGASALVPIQLRQPDRGFFSSSFAKRIGIALVLVAGTLAAFGIASIFTTDESTLSRVLKPYSDGYISPDADGAEASNQSAFVQRAVELTEQFAENRGFLVKVENALERANLPLRAGETIFFASAAVVLGTLLVAVLTRNPVIALVTLGFLLLVPSAVLNFLAGRRKKKFEGQLPDMLTLLAGTLRAGFSLMQGVEAVSQEVEDPMGKELRRVVTESRLGRPLEEALDGVAVRMGSLDFAWAVMAIRIQREVGGNLAELLLTVADTMTQRERLRRDVRTLTAEGRISAIVLGILPVALGIALWVINPEYIETLFTDGLGQLMLGGGLLAALGGYFWMTRIIKIEI